MAEDYYEKEPVYSFLNVEGLFEASEKSARIGSLISGSNKGTGVCFTRFQGRNRRRIQFEVTCMHNESKNNFYFTYTITSLGVLFDPTTNRQHALDVLKNLGGYKNDSHLLRTPPVYTPKQSIQDKLIMLKSRAKH